MCLVEVHSVRCRRFAEYTVECVAVIHKICLNYANGTF